MPTTAAGQPANALKLKQMIMAHHGVFIASPEYTASVHAAAQERDRLGLARARARRSDLCRVQGPRVRDRVGLAGPRRRLALADGAAADSRTRLRRAGDPRAGRDPARRQAFDDMDNLTDTGTANLLRAELARLVDMARLMM